MKFNYCSIKFPKILIIIILIIWILLIYDQNIYSQYSAIATSYDLRILNEFESFLLDRTEYECESFLRDHTDVDYKTFGDNYFYIDSDENESKESGYYLIHILCIVSNKLEDKVKDNSLILKITRISESNDESNKLIHEEILNLTGHSNSYYHPFYLTANLQSGKYHITLSELDNTQNFVNEWTQVVVLNSFEKGNQLFDNRKYDEAITSYNKYLEYNSQYYIAYYNKGLCYYHLFEYDSAIQSFENTIRIKPDYYLAYYMTGLSNYRMNNLIEACNYIRKAVLLKIPLRLIDYKEVVKIYDETISLKLNLFDIYMDKGNLNSSFNKIEHARDDYNNAIKINNTNAEAYYKRGIIYYQMADKYNGVYEKYINLAIEDFEKAIELNHERKNELKKLNKKLRGKM